MSKVMWTGENLDEFVALFQPFEVDVGTDGSKLCIRGVDELSIDLSPGDEVDLSGNGVKVIRVDDGGDRFIEWTGQNRGEVIEFIKHWPEIDVSVIGNALVLDWVEDRSHVMAMRKLNQKMRCFLNIGDRLLARGSMLFVSRAGQEHRV